MKKKIKQEMELCPGCQKSVAGDLYPEHGGTCTQVMPDGEVRRWHVDCYRVYCEGEKK